MTVRGFLMGLLVGGITGAAVGLMFAPMEGRETRRKITDATTVARNKAVGYASTVSERVRGVADTIRPAI